MNLLNQPWAAYERQLAAERRRQTARIFALILIWTLGGVALGIALGLLLRNSV